MNHNVAPLPDGVEEDKINDTIVVERTSEAMKYYFKVKTCHGKYSPRIVLIRISLIAFSHDLVNQ